MTDLDPVDEEADVVAPGLLPLVTQFACDQNAEAIEDLGRDHPLAIGKLSLERRDVDRQRALLRGDVAQLARDLWIVRGERAGADQLDDIGILAVEQG